MELLLASQNRHKQLEMAALLLRHSIIMPSDINIEFSYEETDSTFMGNALGKAEYLYTLTQKPVLADDSGLVVDALGGGPGIFSARYGSDVFGRELSSTEKNFFLLENLRKVPNPKRTARFVCAMALILSPFQRYVVQETVEGYIATKPYGEGGFGYDPVFIVGAGSTTIAELTDSEKNRISHRGIAARRIALLLDDIEQKEIIHVC